MSAESFRSKRSFAGPGSFLVSMVLLSFSSGATWCQADGQPPRAFAGAASAATGFPMLKVGATEIPFGSSEAPTPGETPAILGPSGALLPTARNRPGASGIPLGAAELINPGLSFSPQTVTSKGCTARGRVTGSTGALPTRLFDGNVGRPAGFSLGASNLCQDMALNTVQQGIVTQSKAGIGLGAIELTNGGLAGSIASPTAQRQ